LPPLRTTSPRARGEGVISVAALGAIPGLRGTLEAKASLKALTWFRTGGPAEMLFTPADEADLALFLAGCPAEVPVTVIGLGSNLLVRDGGVPGVVIRLSKAFAAIAVEPGHRVRAGAGAPDVKVARAAAEAGIDGLTFLRGIPGAIGGALAMNGGAYGGEVADVLVEARALDRAGRVRVMSRAEMAFGYRECAAARDLIFTEALFAGTPGEPAAILAAMNAITEARQASQPVNTRTGGSTFRNPPGHKAWELVDRAGCRGLRIGDAGVSDLHTNFLVNRGQASAAEIEALGEEVRRRVRDMSGIDLHWEIKRIGVAAAAPAP
jgi:UDP-N-acetylmuramate dehydrogenase